MISKVLERQKNKCSKQHIDLPACVLQNLVWNKNITSGKDLKSENYYFKCYRAEYKPVHSISTNVLSSKYIRPALKKINEQVENAIINNNTADLSYPYKVELITSKDKKVVSYRFSPNRERYTALRLYAYFEGQNSGKKTLDKLSLSRITFHNLFHSPIRDAEWLINTYRSVQNPSLSEAKQLEYTSNHVIAILNHLNQIAEEKEKKVKYTLDIIYSAPQPTGYQATYVFHRQETSGKTNVSTANNSAYYYSTEKTKPIFYYKMSKWAYMLHVFLFHIYQQEEFCKATITYDNGNIKDTVVELDAKKMWDFWYHIPDHTNPYLTEEDKKEIERRGNERTNTGKKRTGITSPHTSFYNEFEKAIKEINNFFILKTDGDGAEKAPTIFLLPDKIHTTYQKLYHTYKNPANGKYYIQINVELFEDMVSHKCTSTYPKAYAHFFPKTSYSQMRFLEYLLPHTTILDKNIFFSVPLLSIATGNFDISYYKINKHFSDLNSTDQIGTPEEKLFTSYERHHTLGYLFYEQFIKETITKLNKRLQVLGSTVGYKTAYITGSSQVPVVPSIKFSLAPIDAALKQYEEKDAP